MIKSLGEGVSYIGVDDLELDLFEGQYIIPEGIAYNSYLIEDEDIALIDTVDALLGEQWLGQLRTVLCGRTPDYLVVHHLEPDHSGSIERVMKEYPTMKLVLGARAATMLGQFAAVPSERCLIVKEGDTLELGRHSLRFFAAPMVHWPEVMVSFDSLDGALYSADAFGKFGALSKCGFRGSDDKDWACEARRYYFNIVGKYGVSVQTLLKKLSGLPLKTIRALHGPLLEEKLEYYLNLYDTWSRYEAETDGVFIAYASIYGHTKQAAQLLCEMLEAKGVTVAISDLCRSDIAENVEDAFRYSRMVLAAPTYDGGLFSPMYDFLHRLEIKNYSSRKVALLENGSWAPAAARIMREMLSKMKNVEVLDNVVTIKTSLTPENREALKKLSEELA